MSYQVSGTAAIFLTGSREVFPFLLPGDCPVPCRLPSLLSILPNKSVLRKTLARRMNTVIGPSMLSNDCLRAVMMNCTKWTGHVGSHNLRSRLLYVMLCIKARKNDCIVCMPIP